jgi:predicted HTH transcriptional regulator
MRRIGICEERGSGFDKDDKIRACYLHSWLKYVNREYLTNTSLGERFGLKATEKSKVSMFTCLGMSLLETI